MRNSLQQLASIKIYQQAEHATNAKQRNASILPTAIAIAN